MKSILTATLLAAGLLFAATAAQAVDGASSVAAMQQRKHDADLRAQFARDGRWEEIRQLDEVTAQRAQSQREQRYVRVNEQLSHGNGVAGEIIDARALDCEADAVHVR